MFVQAITERGRILRKASKGLEKAFYSEERHDIEGIGIVIPERLGYSLCSDLGIFILDIKDAHFYARKWAQNHYLEILGEDGRQMRQKDFDEFCYRIVDKLHTYRRMKSSEYTSAYSVCFLDGMDEEIYGSECVIFSTEYEIEDVAWKHAKELGITLNNTSSAPDQEWEISPCVAELSDEDVAWMIYKGEKWYSGSKREWLQEGEYQYRKVESAIFEKWQYCPDLEYCERILPLVQDLFRERN